MSSTEPHDSVQRPSLETMFRSAGRASGLLKTLSHESRLLILCILSEGEKSVTQLEAILDMRQPAISQQLARLRFDGLVDTRREGKAIYYRIASPQAQRVIGLLYDIYCGDENGSRD